MKLKQKKEKTKKTVSNASLAIGRILDALEAEEFSISNFLAIRIKIEYFFYELDRHITRKIKDEFYELDFTSQDLVSVATSAQTVLNKYQGKCSYASMKKDLKQMMPIKAGDFTKWQGERCDLFALVASLRRMISVFSYQAILVELLENDEEEHKMENVLLNTLREELKRGKGVTIKDA